MNKLNSNNKTVKYKGLLIGAIFSVLIACIVSCLYIHTDWQNKIADERITTFEENYGEDYINSLENKLDNLEKECELAELNTDDIFISKAKEYISRRYNYEGKEKKVWKKVREDVKHLISDDMYDNFSSFFNPDFYGNMTQNSQTNSQKTMELLTICSNEPSAKESSGYGADGPITFSYDECIVCATGIQDNSNKVCIKITFHKLKDGDWNIVNEYITSYEVTK